MVWGAAKRFPWSLDERLNHKMTAIFLIFFAIVFSANLSLTITKLSIPTLFSSFSKRQIWPNKQTHAKKSIFQIGLMKNYPQHQL
jgi:hypothetical protein